VKLTPEHDELTRSLIRFIETGINPHVREWAASPPFPAHELFSQLGELGFLGIDKPRACGGFGLDFSYAAAFLEALGHIDCIGVTTAIMVQTQMATPALARFGSPELQQRFLAPAVAGEQVAAIAVSEPGAGSDVAAIRTTARRDGDDYVIDGSKLWITNGAQADWLCLLANTGDGPPHRNKSLICIPTDAPGFTVGRVIRKIGMHASDTAELYFDGVRVPRRYRIGEEGQGFAYQMVQFQEERLAVALSALRQLEASIEETIDYTRERPLFGRTVLDQQVVHFRLAELKTELEALRALVWKTVERHVAGEDMTELASMCKLKATRLMRETHDACLQFWGGMGFVEDTSVARRFRDSRVGSIGGGADEVMLSIIAKHMGTLPERGD
jgi:citronellyl-CoA dehydrogenase